MLFSFDYLIFLYCLGIATKDAPNMCHGYVALLGSDDQVFYLKITLNIHASLEILKNLPPWLCCVKTFILLKELGLEPCWQPPPSQRGLPGQLSTAQQRPKISGFIFFKTQRMVQLSNYQKCNLLCRFSPWCIWLCDSGWGEDTSHSGLWW